MTSLRVRATRSAHEGSRLSRRDFDKATLISAEGFFDVQDDGDVARVPVTLVTLRSARLSWMDRQRDVASVEFLYS
jgi:hypothetical protein